MRYKYLDIIKKFNEEIVKLINDGWTLIPHTYSNGVLHENFIKGNQAKVLEIAKNRSYDIDETMSHRNKYIIQVHTSNLKYKFTNNMSSWDYKADDCVTEVIDVFYEISFGCDIYTNSYEECQEIGKIQNERRALQMCEQIFMCRTILSDKAFPIALKFMKKQPKCKSIKIKDIKKVEKEIKEDGTAAYYIYAKDNCYQLR